MAVRTGETGNAGVTCQCPLEGAGRRTLPGTGPGSGRLPVPLGCGAPRPGRDGHRPARGGSRAPDPRLRRHPGARPRQGGSAGARQGGSARPPAGSGRAGAPAGRGRVMSPPAMSLPPRPRRPVLKAATAGAALARALTVCPHRTWPRRACGRC